MSDIKFPVTSASVVIGYLGKDGKENEVVHTVDGDVVEIISCIHDVKKKMRPSKNEDGSLVGFEPTGEEELTLKVKYIRS